MAASACYQIRIVALLAFLFHCSFLSSQGKRPEDISSRDRPIFQVPVNIVVVNATVLDKLGNPVSDLTQNNFKIFEDGKPQIIQTFAIESYASAKTEEKAAEGVSRPDSATGPGPTRPRSISILIDDITTAASRDKNTLPLKAITQFIEQDVRTGDQVAIVSGSGRVQFPFSDNKQTLLEELRAASLKLNPDGVVKSECPTLTNVEAKKISERYLDDLTKAPTNWICD